MANWIRRTAPYTFLKSRDPALDEQVGWLRLGAAHPAEITGDPDQTHWKVVGDRVTLKPLAEIAAEAAHRTCCAAGELALEATREHLALTTLQSHLEAAGKDATKIAARAAKELARINAAMKDMP
ncbi:MAG: hypothetical protein ACE5D3_00010 [Candidatus Binatia bacterium]